MFAKFISETEIQPAPRAIRIGDTVYTNPNGETYSLAGYYEVVDNIDKKEPKKWYHDINHYELKTVEGALPWIEHSLVEEKDECPDYGNTVNSLIRERYSLSQELAILRQQNKSEEKHAEFVEYDTFCDACKTQVRAMIEEWEEA